MYLHVGNNKSIRIKDIIGIFDTDNATRSPVTKKYLSAAEKEGRLTVAVEEIPKSFILTSQGRKEHVYMTQLSVSSIEGRWKRKNTHL